MTTEQTKAAPGSYRFMLPLVLGTMMNPLNSTMLATALVPLCNSLKISAGQGAILITSLYVTSTIAQPLMGRLADIFSAKKINMMGFGFVFLAAAIGTIAPNLFWLIVSRVLLGLGTSAAYPSAMALINRKYAEADLPVPGNILGIVAIANQVSMVVGPVLGGLITQYLGWRGIFFINIPWILIALYLSQVIPDYAAPAKKDQDTLFNRLDVYGILIFSFFLLSLLLLLIQHHFEWQFLLPPVILLTLLIVVERRQHTPFIDVRLLVTKPALMMVYLRTMATSYIFYHLLYGFPQWLEEVKHFPPAQTGLLLLPDSVVAIAVGLLITKGTRLFRQNLLGVVFLLITCIGLFLMNVHTSVWIIFTFTLILGVAEGINMIANQALLNTEAPMAQKGVSFGLYRTFGYLGAIISSSQLKVLFHSGVTDERFHVLGIYALYSCAILVILLIPLWVRRKQLTTG